MSAYGTNAGGTTYFATRLNTTAWDNASDADRTAARTMATQSIDALNFAGIRADIDQDNQFPRYDDSSVPTEVEYATYEIALKLLEGRDPQEEFEAAALIQNQFGGVRSTKQPSSAPEYILAGIPSLEAWKLLKPFLREGGDVRLDRIS